MAAPCPPSPNEPKSAGDAKSSAKPEGGQVSGNVSPSTANSNKDVPANPLPLTYANTKNSDGYSTAKSKLNEGDFEGSLETVETALKVTLSLLPDADELHESLAPLYYLYGTTLLYSVEESTESAEASVMVQQQEKEEEAPPGAGGGAAPSDNAEDLQIAWENLDTARAIVSRIATSSHFAKSASTDPADAEGRDLVLDLAQIHARLGDLQRANGNYGPALSDFQKALDIRTGALGMYDRRVADVYYRLGTTCVAVAAEGEKARQQAAVKGGDGSSSASPEGGTGPRLTPAQIAEHREQSVAHFLACGRSLGGVVGKLCGKNPDEVASVPSGNGEDDDGADSDSDDDEGKGKGKAKATAASSDDEAKSTASSAAAAQASSSMALKVIRERVADLEPTKASDTDIVSDLRELLDEIQEAIDTAKEDMQGLSDMSEMKAKAEVDIETEDKAALEKGLEASKAIGGDSKGGGGITTVGFGAPSSLSASTSTDTPAVVAMPMMVVKKKKKKRDHEGQGNDDPKRSKTE